MNCPSCGFEWTYEEDNMMVCSACQFKWSLNADKETTQEVKAFLDANGNELNDGDSIIVIKDLKIKGSSDVVKQGTKVNNIKLFEPGSDGHDIDCRIPGIGAMKLKTEFVKKA